MTPSRSQPPSLPRRLRRVLVWVTPFHPPAGPSSRIAPKRLRRPRPSGEFMRAGGFSRRSLCRNSKALSTPHPLQEGYARCETRLLASRSSALRLGDARGGGGGEEESEAAAVPSTLHCLPDKGEREVGGVGGNLVGQLVAAAPSVGKVSPSHSPRPRALEATVQPCPPDRTSSGQNGSGVDRVDRVRTSNAGGLLRATPRRPTTP